MGRVIGGKFERRWSRLPLCIFQVPLFEFQSGAVEKDAEVLAVDPLLLADRVALLVIKINGS